MKTSHLVAWICYALYFLLMYASTSKLIAFDFYLYDLGRSPLFKPYALVIAIAIPLSEVLIAVLLLPQRTRLYGLAGATLLMGLFTVYVVYVLGFTNERPCSCGGIIRDLTWPQHLVFNVVVLAVALRAYNLHRKNVFEQQLDAGDTKRLKITL